jgi:uncharacterized protein YerC
MSNISKKKLEKEISDKIHNRFIKTMVDLRGNKGSVFVEELFTPTEKIIFAKRLAGLLMLAQDVSSYKVSKLLRLSLSTTARMRIDYESNKYSSVAEIVKKKKDRDKFWAELEVFVRFGMPEMGKNRWKWLDDFFPQNKK